MKKFYRMLSIVIVLVIAVVSTVAFSGCGKKNEKSSNATTGVVSNGGMVVQKDDYIYFINAVDNTSIANTYGNVTQSAIYKVKVDSTGSTVGEPELFVSNKLGFEFGSISIYGDYLYYATPSMTKDSKGAVLSGLVDFYRIKLDGTDRMKIYTSKNEDDEISYAYYASGTEDLYLLVYEKTEEEIVSVDIGTKPQKTTIAEDVTAVLFSDNGGGSGADSFAFFTKAPKKSSANQIGVLVYKITADGETETEISVGRKISLLAIREGKLIYSDTTDESTNATVRTSDAKDKLSTQDKMISALTYEDIVFTSTYVVAKDTNNCIFKIEWQGSVLNSFEIADADATFVAIANGKVLYTVENILYAVAMEEDATAVKLTNEAIAEPTGLLKPEVIGNYIYFMADKKVADVSVGSYLYRVNINATESVNATIFAKA